MWCGGGLIVGGFFFILMNAPTNKCIFKITRIVVSVSATYVPGLVELSVAGLKV